MEKNKFSLFQIGSQMFKCNEIEGRKISFDIVCRFIH